MRSIEIDLPHLDELSRQGRHLDSFRTRLALLVAAIGLHLFHGPISARAADVVNSPSLPDVRLPAGFEIVPFADERLADDIQTLCIDAQGRVIVSGPGYIRALIDTDGDGRADRKIDYAVSRTGAMGIYSEGSQLFYTGDQGLWRFQDENGDGIADGPPTKIVSLRHGEHGAHGVRQGPDGSWYVMAGNDADVHAGLITDPRSPIRNPEAGSLLRLTKDLKSVGVFAHGLRNPYDFDFNWLGDIFTFDSDVEREFLLPWYTPTRLYHVAYAGHHGWCLPGYERGFHRPDIDPGIVPMARGMGRGSPTGVIAYRHMQFPPRYQNGFFLLDWTFGRVWFSPAMPDGATYQMAPELFLSSLGTEGFAPTAAAVATDGSLLVSIGGRKTRGAVYRIQYTQDPLRLSLSTNWFQLAKTDVEVALLAPQPLSAWSRSIWKPIASKLGPRPFDAAVLDRELPDSLRIRAVEILTELHGGLMTSTAQLASKTPSPYVRARVAWSLGRAPCAHFSPILLELARDGNPLVQRHALEALIEQVESVSAPLVAQAALATAAHSDKRLRQLAARLATFLPIENWKAYYASLMRLGAPSQLACTLAVAWRFPTNGLNQPLIHQTLQALKSAQTSADKLQGVMLLIQGLGGWRLHGASSEVYTPYEAASPPPETTAVNRKIRDSIRPFLLSGDPDLLAETSRLLGMLRDPDPSTSAAMLDRINATSAASLDVHFLAILSRLPFQTNAAVTDRTAEAMLGVSRKLHEMQNRPKQTWHLRMRELNEELLKRDPNLATSLLRSSTLTRVENLPLAAALSGSNRLKAARLLFSASKQNPAERWTSETVTLLSLLPLSETRGLFRSRWKDPAIREALLIALAREPDREDRERFAWGLTSMNGESVNASLDALLALPREPGQVGLEGSLKLLARLGRSPVPEVRPAPVIQLINRLTGQTFSLPEIGSSPALIRQASQPIFDWCAAHAPTTAQQGSQENQTAAEWESLLQQTAWDKGNVEAGGRIFQSRQCLVCHGGVTGIGPDLSGVTRRWSPRDLLTQIRYPNREVPEAYRTTQIETRDGVKHLGILAFFSAEGVMLRTAGGRTERIPQSDIVHQRQAEDSIMPDGLLHGLVSQDLADLYAFLRALDTHPLP